MDDITDRYERLSLEEEEEAGLVIDQEDEVEQQTTLSWVLVGRFTTDRPINFTMMNFTMRALVWKVAC